MAFGYELLKWRRASNVFEDARTVDRGNKMSFIIRGIINTAMRAVALLIRMDSVHWRFINSSVVFTVNQKQGGALKPKITAKTDGCFLVRVL